MTGRTVSIGGTDFTVAAVDREGCWIAEARRLSTGSRVGPVLSGATSGEAMERLVRWLDWQREHDAALAALQAAQQAYHQILAGSAIAAGPEELSSVEAQREALQRLAEARVRLDEIRQAQAII